MPQFFKRKSNRGYRSSTEALQIAAEECNKGQSLRKAAAMFDLDKITLQRYFKKVQMDYKNISLSHYVFCPEMEKE